VFEHVVTLLLAQQPALQHALGQFLDKQRHAVGTIDDLDDDVIGQGFAAGGLRHKSGSVEPIQAMKHQHRHMRLAGPGLLELGTEGDDQ